MQVLHRFPSIPIPHSSNGGMWMPNVNSTPLLLLWYRKRIRTIAIVVAWQQCMKALSHVAWIWFHWCQFSVHTSWNRCKCLMPYARHSTQRADWQHIAKSLHADIDALIQRLWIVIAPAGILRVFDYFITLYCRHCGASVRYDVICHLIKRLRPFRNETRINGHGNASWLIQLEIRVMEMSDLMRLSFRMHTSVGVENTVPKKKNQSCLELVRELVKIYLFN